ncbi:hypothetical protein TruAng_010782 [Truncatella angustata]|nr:hypothetical protein TruAng_010782 [Truncatella angustata]
MRRTLRLFAAVKPVRYLEAGNPTGLTGLYTHNSPRSTLLYLYGSTLDKIKTAPESSLYRQSIEAQTKHRMSIVSAAVPPGYNEWQQNAQKILKENPEGFNIASQAAINGAQAQIITRGNQIFLMRHDPIKEDERYEEWDGEVDEGGEKEGLRTEAERADQELFFSRKPMEIKPKVTWEPEPQLTADQVEEIEQKIGAGLIEEVVQMAESELKLLDLMLQAKPWEELEEKPAEGQWTYFERNSSIGESVAYQYAILSHTWDGDELTLQEMEGPHKKIKEKRGYLKVAGACALALENGFKYIWIDTCCIDKTNSVELSEAINSMWQWYKESAVCYVYLVDIPDHLSARNLDRRGDMKFQTSRWFTRGWTLQVSIQGR